MRIVFVGGGTGGHFYPLIAIAEAVRETDKKLGQNSDLYYMGPSVYSQESLLKQQIKFVYCPSGKQREYHSFENYLDTFKIMAGIFIAFLKLYLIYPDVVMSKGGFTSVPVVIAAWLLRIPIVIHESDAVPGKANKFAARFARYIGIAHDEVATYFPPKKVALVGMPIRQDFFIPMDNPARLLGIPDDRPIILVTGGSSGAQRLNDFVIASLPKLLVSYTVVHQVGLANESKVTEAASVLITDHQMLEHYFVLGHISPSDFAAALRASSLVITRAGSTTLFEIALAEKPSIVVPIPEDISRDQRSNAYAYARSGSATVLEEHNLSDDILVAEIHRILKTPQVYEKMRSAALGFTSPKAAYTLADTLRAIAKEHE